MKPIKIILIVLLAVAACYSVVAQQESIYTFNQEGQGMYNPSGIGLDKYGVVMLRSRLQYLGIDGAPSNHNLYFKMPVVNTPISWGLHVAYDAIGPYKTLGLYGLGAYRLRITRKSSVSFGLRLGIVSLNDQSSSLGLIQTDDIVGQSAVENTNLPNGGAGITYKRKEWTIGISVPNVVQNWVKLKQTDLQYRFVNRHYYIHGSYQTKINRDITLDAFAKINLLQNVPLSFDINAMANFNQRIGAGLSYRLGDSVGLLTSFTINDFFSLYYGYEVAVSRLGSYSSGSHEIVLKYLIPKYSPSNVHPRYF